MITSSQKYSTHTPPNKQFTKTQYVQEKQNIMSTQFATDGLERILDTNLCSSIINIKSSFVLKTTSKGILLPSNLFQTSEAINKSKNQSRCNILKLY